MYRIICGLPCCHLSVRDSEDVIVPVTFNHDYQEYYSFQKDLKAPPPDYDSVKGVKDETLDFKVGDLL